MKTMNEKHFDEEIRENFRERLIATDSVHDELLFLDVQLILVV